ncbi:YolD-like family protein [Paenibacillus provencensis]|uniref:YolD-like family protein n=1 Tax=Paenibacillus provencensis TaxID=441151 RepID=A0ABW3PNM7_9BACL|nr:YolD-like family protein [Paenibacillus sp. MER 78]
MKGNKLAPGSNMFWESSRMMLPEHREAFVEHERVHDRNDRFYLDDQEKEIVNRALLVSFQQRLLVNVQLYDEYEDRRVIGVVEMVDTRLRRFKVDGEWFEVSDVLRADIEGYD